MNLSDNAVEEILGDTGPFASVNPHFKVRKEQQQMAVAVNQAIYECHNLLVEAGTGVGKTFAYLVPALLSGKQVVISTGTKNLQDQLYKRDLPAVYKILNISPQTALLKGRANYLCEYRLESTLAAGRLPDPTAVKHLGIVTQWRDKTIAGDLNELSDLPENSPLISYITSTADNCLGQDCPFFEKCYLAKAREKARQAKVLVVNHHILLADLVLKEDGFGELLPDTDIFVIDEAHHLVKTAYQFYGSVLSSRQLTELCRELELEYRTQVTDCRDLMLAAQTLAVEVKAFRLALPEYDIKDDWQPNAVLKKKYRELYIKINELYNVVKVNSTRTKVLESCFERLQYFIEVMHYFNHFDGLPIENMAVISAEGETEFAPKDNEVRINWFETAKSGFRLHSTPLDVARFFQQSRQRYRHSSWILTSATLTVNNQFNHFIDALGWESIKTLMLPSSFDYQRQSLLYVPRGLPSTRDTNHTYYSMQAIMPILETIRGRTFILFTSHRALKTGAELLREHTEFECLVQGEGSKQALLEQFVAMPNSLLLATGSFWEGVDVAGDSLVLVIIDKLPFAPPDDPILNAKMVRCREMGGNPFYDLQIPEAVLTLKQGVGRLIRSVRDRGVVCLCDTRLVGKSYGEVFVNSLPNMRRTRDPQLVIEFLTDIMDSIDC
ncbi:ATP-dependent DNA helicase [Aliikangiella maris]|uniref:ATP-dependent DNA helicase n=2 Tax=Aliikangiella maris TaxID=3162458 RepID=A0ABV3MLV5_9GAMM